MIEMNLVFTPEQIAAKFEKLIYDEDPIMNENFERFVKLMFLIKGTEKQRIIEEAEGEEFKILIDRLLEIYSPEIDQFQPPKKMVNSWKKSLNSIRREIQSVVSCFRNKRGFINAK